MKSLLAYSNLDRVFGSIRGYLAYRVAATRCFFSGPRLGHDYEGSCLYAECQRCPKVWIGNV